MNKTDDKNTKKNELKEKIPFSKGVLKSAVQKAIRKGEVEKAVRCTKSFLELDELDCLRRSMIWPVEDVLLHPAYDELAKLTYKLSQKGSVPLTEAEKTKILTIVGDVARCEWRDLDVGNPDDEGKDYVMQPVKGDKENSLIDALLYRSRIGGSKWDWIMLNQMARVWNKRFSEGTWKAEDLKQYATGEVIEWANVPYATLDDIMLETVDMHCSSLLQLLLKIGWIKDLLRKELPFNKRDWLGGDVSDYNLLEQIIWCCRSSINYKKNIWETQVGKNKPVSWLWADKVPETMWPVYRHIMEEIREEADNISRWVIRSQGEK